MKTTIALLFAIILSSASIGAVPVPKGSSVKLILQEDLSSKSNHVDDLVPFKVAEDIKIEDNTVIRKDAEAFGKIAEIVPRRLLGLGAIMKLKGMYVTTVEGKKINITLEERKVGSWAVSLFIPYQRGHDVEMKKGAEVIAFIAEDANVFSLEEKIPRWTIVGGKQQELRTSAFLFRADVQNAKTITAVYVNGEAINFTKGATPIEILAPILTEKIIFASTSVALMQSDSSSAPAQVVGDVPVAFHLEDGTVLQDSVKLIRAPHPLSGTVVKADTDGAFINLGAEDGIHSGICFRLKDKGYVYVTEVFEKTAKVALLPYNPTIQIKVNDVIQ